MFHQISLVFMNYSRAGSLNSAAVTADKASQINIFFRENDWRNYISFMRIDISVLFLDSMEMDLLD